jgi:NAD(P)-dependent dehydrogenase (short-subunit alcohol dehydrogenase family)
MSMNPPLLDWRGRVAWLVGASSGIGRATAAALHRAGATVVVSARSAAALQAFVDQHPGSDAIALDVNERDSMQRAKDLLLARHGRVDLSMYCAGHYKPMSALDFDLAEALRHLDVNFIGALHWLDALLPVLADARRGHLSLVASVAGYRGLPRALAYGPTKAALQHLADALYLDLHAHGIGVSVINPGFVDTPLTAQNDFRMPALISPEAAAAEILAGWRDGRFEIHFPRRFTRWLKLLRHLGHGAYFRAVRGATHL